MSRKKPAPAQGWLFTPPELTPVEALAVRLHKMGYSDEAIAHDLRKDHGDRCLISPDWVRSAVTRSAWTGDSYGYDQ